MIDAENYNEGFYDMEEIHRVMEDVEGLADKLNGIAMKVSPYSDWQLKDTLSAAVITLDKAIEIHQRS